ncbi:MAG TPA: cytochrome c family protein [Xanthobacteraceae bacterium]|jgi:cytochrome c|nr:cytochrome c family protein [Xanthobacteraceae bacterium]
MRTLLAISFSLALCSTALAADPASGEQAFKACAACHAIGSNAKNKLGPELNGIVGRTWGTVAGFNYSSDLAEGKTSGKTWDEATLDKYLENPKAVAPKGKMPYAGLKDAAKRGDLIAYLKQFDAAGNKK